MNVFHRTICRLCDSKDLQLVLSLTPTPAADDYVTAEQRPVSQGVYPLNLHLCNECGHVQMLDVVPPEKLFVDYLYETSSSLGLVDHFRRYVDEILCRFSPSPGSLVVDIGSNDGSFLREFQKRGLTVLGVDPAQKIALKANESGVETVPDFFNADVARKIRRERGPASIVTANNAFGHSDDLAGISQGVCALLASDGLFVFEVSYLGDFISEFLFDTVYHEHLSYHALKPLKGFLERNGLELIGARRVPTKGGSLRGYAQRKGGPRPIDSSVRKIIKVEEKQGLFRTETFKTFSARIEATKKELTALLADVQKDGKTVVGYGASPSSTTLIYHFGLGSFLSFLVDDNPLKHGRFSPGIHLPVLPSKALYEKKSDFVIILAWTYAQPILFKHRAFSQAGGRFIRPLPKVELV
jgi:SAM-dependent methyltransferase